MFAIITTSTSINRLITIDRPSLRKTLFLTCRYVHTSA